MLQLWRYNGFPESVQSQPHFRQAPYTQSPNFARVCAFATASTARTLLFLLPAFRPLGPRFQITSWGPSANHSPLCPAGLGACLFCILKPDSSSRLTLTRVKSYL